VLEPNEIFNIDDWHLDDPRAVYSGNWKMLKKILLHIEKVHGCSGV
jgi:hypothetical protein